MALGQMMGRTDNAIHHRASKLGVKWGFKSKRWSREEDQKLLELAGTMSIEEAAEILGRSYGSLISRIGILKIDWRANYKHHSSTQAAEILGLSEDGFKGLISRLEIKPSATWGKRSRYHVWTSEQLEQMQERLDAEARGEAPSGHKLEAMKRYADIPDLYIYKCKCGKWVMRTRDYETKRRRTGKVPTCTVCRRKDASEFMSNPRSIERQVWSTSQRAKKAVRKIDQLLSQPASLL